MSVGALASDRPRLQRQRCGGACLWVAASAAAAILVLVPIVSLAAIAAGGSGDAWGHLITNVLPAAALNTALLLLGVGVLTIALGTGGAWLVTAYDFPGRRVLDWALLLPLAVPTYIVAYAYLDLLHPIGPVQTFIRAIFGIASPHDFRLPDIRSIPGAALLLGFVLYPYVYLSTRALFLMQAAGLVDAARTLGAGQGAGLLPGGAAAGAAGDRGRRKPRADGDAQRRRRLGIPRRPDADAVDLLDLDQPVEPCGRGAARSGDARGRGDPHRRSSGPPGAASASAPRRSGPRRRRAGNSAAGRQLRGSQRD